MIHVSSLEEQAATEVPRPNLRLMIFNSPDAYEIRLKRHGFARIGEGCWSGAEHATAVLAKPEADAVVKVGFVPDYDPWPAYAEWSIRNPGPFTVPVRSIRWHGRRRFYVATMDRLYDPLNLYNPATMPPDPEGERTMDAVFSWYDAIAAYGVSPYEAQPHIPYDVLATSLAEAFREHGQDDKAAFIETLHAAFPRCMFDPKPANWMYTADRQLVFIDPFLRTPERLPPLSDRMIANVPTTVPRLAN